MSYVTCIVTSVTWNVPLLVLCELYNHKCPLNCTSTNDTWSVPSHVLSDVYRRKCCVNCIITSVTWTVPSHVLRDVYHHKCYVHCTVTVVIEGCDESRNHLHGVPACSSCIVLGKNGSVFCHSKYQVSFCYCIQSPWRGRDFFFSRNGCCVGWTWISRCLVQRSPYRIAIHKI
jgi:hypothetical protein